MSKYRSGSNESPGDDICTGCGDKLRDHVDLSVFGGGRAAVCMDAALASRERVDRVRVQRALRHQTQADAAKDLGLSRRGLYLMRKRLGLLKGRRRRG